MRFLSIEAVLRLVLPFAAILATGGCTSSGALPPPSFATDASQSMVREYHLRVGDKIKVTVFGEEQISGTYEVNSLGQVSLPLIGEANAKGLSRAQFRDAIRAKYAQGYLVNPKITVQVTNYRPVFVHGEVKNGGEFSFKSGLKIRDAIAMAGGYTYRADKSFVVIVREGYPAARLRLPSAVEVLPGDNIRVEERFF